MLKKRASVSPEEASSRAADPPTGTVTFLFTEIEGSTLLYKNCPHQMDAPPSPGTMRSYAPPWRTTEATSSRRAQKESLTNHPRGLAFSFSSSIASGDLASVLSNSSLVFSTSLNSWMLRPRLRPISGRRLAH